MNPMKKALSKRGGGGGVQRFTVSTQHRQQMVDITSQIQAATRKAEISNGLVVVFVPHTTAGVCIQENADPDVRHDVLRKLAELIPHREGYYQHAEGNSDSHLMTMMVGSSETLLLDRGDLVLGRWQGVYLCEFDGPRERTVCVSILSDDAPQRD